MKIQNVCEAKRRYTRMPICAFGAMMTRNHTVFAKDERTPENEECLRNLLKAEAGAIINKGDYKKRALGTDKCAVGESAHIANIQKLAEKAGEECGGFLHRGELRFGTAQKYLNVELKWR